MAWMAKKPKPAQTPFERFTEASRKLFNLPKETVQETIKKYPAPRRSNRKKRTRKS
jgi:hypothetical protein